MIKRVTWEEFRSNGFLWAVNSFLHIFGFAIVCKFEGDKVVDVEEDGQKVRKIRIIAFINVIPPI